MSLFQIEFNERELITLRIIFNSNSGLNKIIASAISLNEIRSLNQESINKLRFRHSEDIMNKLQNYNSYESQAIDILEWCESNNISVVSIFNENYPNRLRKIHNPPCLLFCAGDKNLLNMKKSIAIVGSREVGDIGINVTEKTTSFFAPSPNKALIICLFFSVANASPFLILIKLLPFINIALGIVVYFLA